MADGPCFLADAVTDPLAGLVAAAAVLEALAAGGRWLLDVALAPLAAAVAGPALDVAGVAAQPPRARPGGPPGPSAGIGHGHGAGRVAVVSSLVLRHAEVEGARVDVRVEGGTITAVGAPGEVPGADRGAGRRADLVIECDGGALLPGLHDHHLHLLSMAAAAASVDVSGGLDEAIRAAHAQAPPGTAIRAVRYDEGRDGPLDRWRLDALAPGRAVRVQHRSGACGS